MKAMMEKIENRAIERYGFEAWQTIAIFKLTDKLEKFLQR